ncbi:MAG: DNA polymerase III subunit delta' [Tepidisphaeraceae bacterium]|jgi:DNA polymerase-3 subunit delta'
MLKFKDISGQDSAIEDLLRAYRADRLPHGLIFAGPTGVGKQMTATALATLFLCEKPRNDSPCGKCQSCQSMDLSVHPDYHFITKELARQHDKSGTSKATQIAIQVIREELSVPAGRKPALGRGKVFVIEEAELMTAAAQNALLKTLEEPLGRALIMLLTPSPAELLATVRSRCQTIRFLPLDTQWIERQLIDRKIDPSSAKLAADLSDGSLGTALRWIEDAALEPAGAITQRIDSLLQGEPAADLAELLKKSAESLAQKTLGRDPLASKDAATRGGLSVYLSVISRRLRKSLRDEPDPAQAEFTCRFIEAVARAEKYLDANVNLSLVLEQLGLSLTAN